MKVAIIGGGIFGTSAALAMPPNFDVTIFERSDKLLGQATAHNQLRLHMGYHYPRSDQTVEQIKKAMPSFIKEYGGSIIGDFPSYYPVIKQGSMTSAKDFLAFCDKHKLPYTVGWPENKEYLNKDLMEICIITPEKVYDPTILRQIIEQKIAAKKHIKVMLNTTVISGSKDKTKKLTYAQNQKETTQEFDILINATYSQYNIFNEWFNFPKKEIRYDLRENVEIELPNTPKFAVTIMDGPFCTIVPFGNKGTFSLGHVEHSKVDAKVGTHLPKELDSYNQKIPSKAQLILAESTKYMPILAHAKIVRPLQITRAILPNVEHTDARPSELIINGDNCYSLFGGKVITAVDMAQELVEHIQKSN